MIEVATLQTLGGPDMSHATFSAPDMTAYCGLEELRSSGALDALFERLDAGEIEMTGSQVGLGLCC